MKQPSRLTLITSGPTRHNLFARFPALAASLGPIRATSPRTATRAAKLLRGGWAAESWQDVLGSPLIVVQRPGPKLFAEMHALGKAAWRGQMVLACDAEADLRGLAVLEALGAGVVHLHSLDPREPLVALSGDNIGMSRARRVLMASGVRCLSIRDGAGPTLLAAIRSLEKRIGAALKEGDQAFLHAGLRGPEARVVGVGAALRALRR
jgi:hypothetical protein